MMLGIDADSIDAFSPLLLPLAGLRPADRRWVEDAIDGVEICLAPRLPMRQLKAIIYGLWGYWLVSGKSTNGQSVVDVFSVQHISKIMRRASNGTCESKPKAGIMLAFEE
jgi:hypothetical protein